MPAFCKKQSDEKKLERFIQHDSAVCRGSQLEEALNMSFGAASGGRVVAFKDIISSAV